MNTYYSGDKTIESKTVIILINYNGINDTVECIQSIHEKSNEQPFVVVLDNASRDASSLEESLAFYPLLKVIKNETNVGFGRANNAAINWVFNNVNCQYIFILNNDTILSENLTENLASALHAAPDNVALITPMIMNHNNPQEIWYGGGQINFDKMTAVVNDDLLSALNTELDNFKSGYVDFVTGCAMFFKADVLKKLRGFDPFYFMYDEDVELSIRISENGYKMLYIPTLKLYHKCQGSQITKQQNVPSNQLHPTHPSLIFYLKNTIINRRYTLRKHLQGKKAKVYVKFNFYWLTKACQYLLYGKFNAAGTTIACLFKPFNNYYHSH